jgi:signal transduction histidine kinase
MGRLPRLSSTGGEARRPSVAVWAVVCSGVLVGIGAEALSFGLADPGSWVPDLIVGWMCIGSGALVAARRPESRMGLLLAGAGFAWFIGNAASMPVAGLAAIAAQLTLVHRAVLIHAALTLPSGRITGSVQLAAIAVAYLGWSIPASAASPIITLALGGIAALAAVLGVLAAARPVRRARLVGLAGAVLLGGAFALASVVHTANPSGAADRVVLLIDEATIVIVVGGLTVATLLPRLRMRPITDLVVEASRARSGVVRATLAAAVGDPSLEVGYWHSPSGRYLDASGEPLALPAEGDSRSMLTIDLDDAPAAVLVHDPGTFETTSLTDAVRAATVLGAANARLRSILLDQLAEVRASRRRLVLAADAELGRLERRIDAGPLQRTGSLVASLAGIEAEAVARNAATVAERVGRARASLAAANDELEALARGLSPAIAADGLATALHSLARRSPVPVSLAYEAGAVPEPIGLALYYACSEAIANVLKHAEASAVQVRVWRNGPRVLLEVADDGAGGADPSEGSGLRGLQDRIEAMDGRLDIVSTAGSGTHFVAEIPLRDDDGQADP